MNLLNAIAKKTPSKTFKDLYVEAVIVGNDIIENDMKIYLFVIKKENNSQIKNGAVLEEPMKK